MSFSLCLKLKNQLNAENEDDTKQAVSTVETKTVANEESYIDHNKMACLLCKRRFESLEILNKHVLKSDLHKVGHLS